MWHWFGCYHAQYHGGDVPADHTLVVGDRRLVEISFNHRRAFVDAAVVLSCAEPGGRLVPTAAYQE